MRVLIVKTSSMGDVLHTLPALTDAVEAFPTIEFDWVVEPGFADIPRWHPAVKEIIEAPMRRWRKRWWQSWQQGEIQAVIHHIRQVHYDYVIDAQGLFKSAWLTRVANGKRVGFDYTSVREKIACFAYQQRYTVPKGQHAVERLRQLFALALGYSVPDRPVDYGIELSRLVSSPYSGNYLLFLHGTTWPTKHWPESYWGQLTALATDAGYVVMLPWGNDVEYARAQTIKQQVEQSSSCAHVEILPKLTLRAIAGVIAKARGVVAVDTGLGHLAAALAVPTVSLYGPTDPKLTGAYGRYQQHRASSLSCSPCLSKKCKQKEIGSPVFPPCFESLSPMWIWNTLLRHMNEVVIG